MKEIKEVTFYITIYCLLSRKANNTDNINFSARVTVNFELNIEIILKAVIGVLVRFGIQVQKYSTTVAH